MLPGPPRRQLSRRLPSRPISSTPTVQFWLPQFSLRFSEDKANCFNCPFHSFSLFISSGWSAWERSSTLLACCLSHLLISPCNFFTSSGSWCHNSSLLSSFCLQNFFKEPMFLFYILSTALCNLSIKYWAFFLNWITPGPKPHPAPGVKFPLSAGWC